MPDQIGTYNGQVNGLVQNTTGSLLYDTNTAIDLTDGNSSGTNVAYLQLTNPKSTGSLSTQVNGIDFWFLGASSQTNFILSSISLGFQFNVSALGTLAYTDLSGNVQDTKIQIADGDWHHIGVIQWTQTLGGAYPTYIYVDGQYFSHGTRSLPLAAGSTPLQVGNYNAGLLAWQAANFYVDEIVITQGVSSLATIQAEVAQRYAAGSLLSNVIASGDRIAEVLTLAGYGSIVSGALVVPNYTVNDLPWNQSATITSIAGTGTTATATLASNPWTAGQSVFISGNTYSDSITNITWASGVATVNMTASHAYTVGTNVTITGSSVAAYNGTWAVQSVGSTTWTFVSAYSSTPGTGTGGTTSGPSYYNGLFTVATATSTTFTFASTGTKTISGGAASINSTSAFSVQNLQSPVTSSTALDLIQQVTDTDVGAFFQKPDGSFEFDDQAYLYTATNNATPTGANVWSDTADGSVTTFYEPSTLQVLRDDADLWTTVKVTAQNGTVQTYENTTNEPLYAYSTLTKSNVVSVTNEQALQEAIYLGNLYQSPLPRVGNVELRSQTNNGANLVEMLSPYINDQVRFIRSANGASAAGSIDSAVVIESIRHDFQADPGYWHTSFTLDPFPKRGQNSTPQTFFLLFDDSTYGKFDTTNEYL
jgi:hypothetical protein